jgi:hypothetical protein
MVENGVLFGIADTCRDLYQFDLHPRHDPTYNITYDYGGHEGKRKTIDTANLVVIFRFKLRGIFAHRIYYHL